MHRLGREDRGGEIRGIPLLGSKSLAWLQGHPLRASAGEPVAWGPEHEPPGSWRCLGWKQESPPTASGPLHLVSVVDLCVSCASWANTCFAVIPWTVASRLGSFLPN